MCQSGGLSVTSRFALAAESLQLRPTHCWSADLPDVYYCDSVTGCLDLYPGCLSSALTRFFLLSGGLPQR